MSKKSREKGKRGEREAAQLTGGERTWAHLHDLLAHGRWWEVKLLARGLGPVYAALAEWREHTDESGDGDYPALLMREDRKEWLVVFAYEDWAAGRCNADLDISPSA